MVARDSKETHPTRPRSEPEIIPPDRAAQDARARVRMSMQHADRVYVGRIGPFTIILALAILGLIGMVMLIVLLSVALIWIPVVIALVVIFVMSMALNRYWQRLRLWLARR